MRRLTNNEAREVEGSHSPGSMAAFYISYLRKTWPKCERCGTWETPRACWRGTCPGEEIYDDGTGYFSRTAPR